MGKSTESKFRLGLPFWSRVIAYGGAITGSIAVAERFVPQDAFSIVAFLFLSSVMVGETISLTYEKKIAPRRKSTHH